MMSRRAPTAILPGLAAVCLMIAACAPRPTPTAPSAAYTVGEGTQAPRTGTYKVGKPYQIQGVWYYPAEDYSYNETGVASWYGPDFHAKYTANGEIFDQEDVTAAHRTLPMPCFIRVTNLDNGRSLIVRVNDRGPFAHGRILDLSRRAAEMLDMQLNGTARVRVQILAEESQKLAIALKTQNGEVPPLEAAPRAAVVAETLPPPPGKAAPPPKTKSLPKAAPVANGPSVVADAESVPLADQVVHQQPVNPTQLFIQAGAFSHFDNARHLSGKLSAVGNASISEIHTHAGVLYRVRLGPIATLNDADSLLEQVLHSGFPDARLVVD